MKFLWIKNLLLLLLMMKSTLINACIYSKFFTIYEGSTSATHRSASGSTFIVVWGNSQVGIVATSYIFMGFSLLNQDKAISFQTRINSFNSTSATFFFNPRKNSQIVYAHFSIIALKSCSIEIYLFYHQHTTTILNNDNRSPSSENYNLPVGFAFNKTSYIAIPFISSFYLNSYKDLLDLAISTQPITLSATSITIVLSSGSSYQDGLAMIAFTLILLQTSSLLTSQMSYFTGLLVVPTSSITASAEFTSNNCAIGISYLQTDKFKDNPMSIKLTLSGLVNSSVLYNFTKTLVIINQYSIFCLKSCTVNLYPNGSSCVPCTAFLTGCISCRSKDRCSRCSSGYFIDLAANQTCTLCPAPCLTCTANTTCLTCLSGFYLYQPTLTCINCLPECIACNSSTTCTICSNGTAVQGGCTTDSYCVLVNNSLSFNSLRCIACYPSNIYMPVGGKCVCSRGYLNVSGMCVNIVGCIAAIIINNQPICISCNTSLNFLSSAVNGTCICSNGYYLNSSICLSCLSECVTCSNQVSCLTCMQGNIVQGGCTNNPYCTQVNSTLNFSSKRCLSCRQDFNLIASGGDCICQTGYTMVSGFCLKDSGCIAARLINTTIYCVACNSSKGFQFSPINGVCQCLQGFKLQNQACTEICGDGLLQYDGCDDGNIKNGDGCSSSCQKQSKFLCSGIPSICKYLRYDVSINLVKIEKIFMKNKGLFTFKMTPHLSSYESSYLLKNLNFYSNRSLLITKKSFEDDILTFQVEYTEDLQGFDAQISLPLNQSLFSQESVYYEFKMISSNTKLIILRDQERVRIFIKIIGWFSLSIFILSFLGFFFHKMLGLQLLHSLQVIYIVHLINQYYTTPFSIISYLDSITFNFLFSTNYASNIRAAHHNFSFSQKNQFITELFIVGISLVIVIIVFFGKIYEHCTESLQQKNHRKERVNQIFNRVCFPISVGGLFVFFLIKLAHNQEQSDLPIKFSFFFCTIVFSLILFYEIKIVFGCVKLGWQQCCNTKQKWVSIYLIYHLFVLLLISIKYTVHIFPLEQILTGMYLIFFIMVILYRPYRNQIHNTGIIIHTFTTFYFCSWVVTRKYQENFRLEENQLLGLFILIVLVGVSIGICICRIIFEIRQQLWRQNHKKPINQETIKDKKSDLHQFQEVRRSINLNQETKRFLLHQNLYLNRSNNQQPLNNLSSIPLSFFIQQSEKRSERQKFKNELHAFLLQGIQIQASQENV